ncbi:MAG: MFS transporter [Gemmataceae bacterium]|nr:MFS transporter [Gemmataceae bacterium]
MAAAPSFNDLMLFWASFFTLIAAGMGFAIRGDIIGDWGRQFGFTQTELGIITGQGLAGFGLTIIFFSFFSDLIGYGILMAIAFLFHALSIALTLAAPFAFQSHGKDGAFWCLYLGAWFFSFGNGTCEAVINPLTATLFPHNKTHWLNILHAGWPGGLVLGALVNLGLNQLPSLGLPNAGWQVRWGIVFAPMLLYGLMMVGRPFPKSEAKVSGVPLKTTILTLFSPILLFLFVIHAMVGYVELGTDSWIQNITDTVLRNKTFALVAFIWTNVLMFTLRFFAGPIVHKISPVGLLFGSAVLGTAGLALLGLPATNTALLWLLAVTIYGIGKTFYWPTMLGVISERYPRGGALALGMSGGIGMISAGFLGGPVIGYQQDYAASIDLSNRSPAAYERYKSKEPSAPLPFLPKVAGLDNAKVGVLRDDGKKLAEDLELLRAAKGRDENLEKLAAWWENEGRPNAAADRDVVDAAVLEGGKKALLWTAIVPAIMAGCYLLLIVIFAASGGYKQVHIGDGH